MSRQTRESDMKSSPTKLEYEPHGLIGINGQWPEANL